LERREATAAKISLPPKETGRLSPMDRISERLKNSSTSGGWVFRFVPAGGPEGQVRSGEATSAPGKDKGDKS